MEKSDNEDENTKKGTTDKRTRVIVVALILALLFLYGLFDGEPEANSNTPKDQKGSQNTTQKKKEDKKPEKLDLDLSQNADGLVVTNNEGGLKNCTFEINYGTFRSGFKENVTLQKGKNTIAYGRFTMDDGQRFNPYTHSVENAMISNCEDEGSRFVGWGR